MSRIAIATLCVFSLATPAVAQTQSRTLTKQSSGAPGRATIYVIRPTGIMGTGFTSPDIKIDGRKIGELVGGTFLIAGRPAGHHTLEVQGGVLSTSWESEVDLVAGQTYYYEIGPQSNGAPGSELLAMALAGTSGQRLPGHGLMASYSFLSLDTEHGRAALAGLKNVTP